MSLSRTNGVILKPHGNHSLTSPRAVKNSRLSESARRLRNSGTRPDGVVESARSRATGQR